LLFADTQTNSLFDEEKMGFLETCYTTR